MTGTARDDATATSEQEELISCLERVQESFERRALSSMAEPLISTPVTMQQLKVLTMIAIDPDKATGHELAAPAEGVRWRPCRAWSIDSWSTEW